MMLAEDTALDRAIVAAETPSDLSAIHQPACAAAIWQRQPLPTFQSWIDGLDAEQLPKARIILPK